MAEHSLTIKATLDTSSVQRELESINKNIATMDGSTGGGVGGNGRRGGGIPTTSFKQLQMSIEALNRALGRLETSAKNAVNTSAGGSVSYSPVVDTMRVPTTTRRRGGYSDRFGDGLGNMISGMRLSKTTKMGLGFGAHFTGLIGEKLQDSGYNDLGGGFNILSSTLGGAAAGSLFGPWGSAIGGLTGAITGCINEMTKFEEAVRNASEELAKLSKEEQASYDEYRNDIRFTDTQKEIKANWEDPVKLESLLKEIQGAVSYKSALEESQRAKVDQLHQDVPQYESGQDFNDWYKKQKKHNEESIEAMGEYKRIKAELDKWDGLAEHVKNQITKLYDSEQKEHEKFIDQMLKFYEQREELVKEREQVLAGIEQEYAQNGVDILDNMGKTGKFMTQTAQNSVSQERYAPITKKLDNMQKSLDHLSKIDSKMNKIEQNIGLL